MKMGKWIIIVGLILGFLLGFVKRIIVYPDQKSYFDSYPKFAIAGQTVTVRTAYVTGATMTMSANVETEQISETEYRFKMPFHDVFLRVQIKEDGHGS